MMNRKYNIITDMDDVLSCFLEDLTEAYNYVFDDELSVNDIKEWDLSKSMTKATMEEIFKLMDSPNFILNVMPKERAPFVVRKLIRKGHDLTVVTACTNPNIMIEKQQWLKKFMGIEKGDICFTPKKSVFKGDVFIDDRCLNMSNFDGVRILFTSPHNLTLTPEKDGFDIRVDNWWELEELLSGDKQYIINDLLKTK